jgi:hypothetical protein
MADGDFKFEKCLLKHFVRHQGWLPLCKKRAQSLRTNAGNSRPRLKYFTFCAAGALDVMMLEMEKVIRRSASDMFDTVFFFDVNDTFVAQTRQRVPGAVGFPEEFVKVVLADDTAEGGNIDTIATLEPPEEDKFTTKVVDKNRVLAIRRQFVQSFPFDVINLDLERYLFIPREELPGDLVNALRNVFEWQRRAGTTKDRKKYKIDGFSLMFTLRLGPKELGDDYQKLMKDYITANIANDASLEPLFKKRSADRSVTQFLRDDFEGFFKIAAPKTIMSLLHEQDWHVDPDHGVIAYEFERKTKKDPYRMLHVLMDVKRNSPSRERRGPGVESAAAKQAYATNVKKLFENDAIAVALQLKELGESVIADHLDKVIAHRKKLSGDQG